MKIGVQHQKGQDMQDEGICAPQNETIGSIHIEIRTGLMDLCKELYSLKSELCGHQPTSTNANDVSIEPECMFDDLRYQRSVLIEINGIVAEIKRALG